MLAFLYLLTASPKNDPNSNVLVWLQHHAVSAGGSIVGVLFVLGFIVFAANGYGDSEGN